MGAIELSYRLFGEMLIPTFLLIFLTVYAFVNLFQGDIVTSIEACVLGLLLASVTLVRCNQMIDLLKEEIYSLEDC